MEKLFNAFDVNEQKFLKLMEDYPINAQKYDPSGRIKNAIHFFVKANDNLIEEWRVIHQATTSSSTDPSRFSLNITREINKENLSALSEAGFIMLITTLCVSVEKSLKSVCENEPKISQEQIKQKGGKDSYINHYIKLIQSHITNDVIYTPELEFMRKVRNDYSHEGWSRIRDHIIIDSKIAYSEIDKFSAFYLISYTIKYLADLYEKTILAP